MINPWSEESRKRARKKWRLSAKGKAWDKAYCQRPEVKAKHYIDMAIDRDYPEEVKEIKKENKNSWGIVK